MKLTQFAVDDGPHNSDGLLLHGWDEDQQVTGFISRRVMDDWVDPRQPYRGRKSLYREQYNALGKCNLAAIERVLMSKYERGPAFNRQYPFVDILLSDIIGSGETLDTTELVQRTAASLFPIDVSLGSLSEEEPCGKGSTFFCGRNKRNVFLICSCRCHLRFDD